MIPSSSAASASFRLSFNNSATHARGPFNKLTGVSNTNSQLVRKDAEQQFISHSKSVSELLTQAVSLAKSTLNTSETDSAHTVQRSVSGNISCDTVDSRADVAQVSRGAGSASLNEKIAVALDSLPSGRQFSVGKSEAAKTELFNDLTFSFKDNTLEKFAAIIENADGKSDRSSKAMQCVNDFMVMRHEIKSRLSPDDSKTLKELDNVTKSFISKIVKNGVGMNSFAAGSSKNYSGLKQFQGICNKLVALDKQSQGASGLSHNVDISNRILNALNNAGLSHEESLQVESLFRDSIEQHNDMLSGINNSQNLTPFEQAQTRLGHETIIFDLLANKLADMAQPKADDVANTGPGPEVKAGPSNQPGINITINAPFTYSYHEGNQGSEIPGMASGSQPASATTPDATQTDESAEVGTLSEDIDSSTDPQQNTQRREVENIFERSVQQSPDLSERHIQTTSAAGSPGQLVSRGSGDATDAVNEQHHDVTDAVTGPAVQPTRQDTQRREVENIFERSVQQTSDLSERHIQTTSAAGSPGQLVSRGSGDATDVVNEQHHDVTDAVTRPAVQPTRQDTQRREVENIFERSVQQTSDLSERHIQTTSAAGSPGSAYIGGPGSSSARTNPAESRRTALNNQGTSFQGLNHGQTGGTQNTQRREVENIFERSVQQTPDLSERHIQTTSVAGSPGSAYIGGPGSSSARTNPAESRRTALNNQGTSFQGLNHGQTGGTQNTQRREVENIFERSVQQTPDLSERHTQTTSVAGSPGSAYIGGPGSSSARTNPAESRRTALNNQGTLFQGLNHGQTGGTQNTQRREVENIFERSVQQTPDLSERHIQTTSVAGSPGSAYIGGPGSSSARTNPAESRRTALNNQGTPFQGLKHGQTGGTQDTQRREVNKVFERSVQQTPDLSERHTQTTSVAGSPGSAYIGGPGSSSARTNPAESRRTALNNQGTPFQGLNRGQKGGTQDTQRREVENIFERSVQQTPDLSERHIQTTSVAGSPGSAYIGGPGSSSARTNPAESRRTALNNQGTPFQGLKHGQTGGTQDTQRREVNKVFERSVQQTPDLSERHTQTTSVAGSPGSAYIGGPGSSSARTNPAESRRTALNNQGTPFQGLNRGQKGGTQDTQRREVENIFERSVQQTPDLSERHIQTTSVAGSPGSAYIGGPGSSSARTNPAESRRTALNNQGTPFQGLNGGRARGTAGAPASTGTSGLPRTVGTNTTATKLPRMTPGGTGTLNHQRSQQDMIGGQARRAAGNSAPSGAMDSSYIGGPGSSRAPANPAEARRSTQDEPGMLNRQGTHWQGMDGKQASKVNLEQTYKSSSFVGSRGSSQATPYFSGVSKSTVKK